MKSVGNSRSIAQRAIAGAALLGIAGLSCSSDSAEVEGDGSGLGPMGPIFDLGGGTEQQSTVPGYFAGEACAGQSAGAEAAPSALQLIVDTSGSMNQNAPGARGSKWDVTRRAVLEAVDGMPPDTSLGLIFYPNVPVDAEPCFDRETAVGVAALENQRSQQRQRIQRAFQRQNPNGGTPTHDAYRYALEEISAAPAQGSRFVVLITDGIPTYSLGCEGTGRQEDAVDAAPMIAEAAAAAERGIRTFVIGSPGSEGARESLSRMAEAGGTALSQCSHAGPSYCHFDMTRERDLGEGLVNALGIISGVALSCRYAVPAPQTGGTLDPGKVNVLFTPPGGPQELIGQSQQAGCNEGWQYSDDQRQIRLCSATCERVQASEGNLELQFGCATELR